MKGELGEHLPLLPDCLWAASAKIRVMGPLKQRSLHLQGCGGEAPSSLRQPRPSDYIHVS